MRLFLALLLTSCVPTLPRYAAYTCAQSHAEWTGSGMADPNDSTRIPWPICESRGVRFAVPPQNPRGE